MALHELLLITPEGIQKSFNLHVDGPLPQVVKYNGDLYVPKDHLGLQYIIAKPVNLTDPKVAKPRPAELTQEQIQQVRKHADYYGFACNIRNRDGKQYATFTWSGQSLRNSDWNFTLMPDRPLMRNITDILNLSVSPIQTSGGYRGNSGQTTWRLNP